MNNNLPPIDDWCEHMLWAEQNFKQLERGLINKESSSKERLEHQIKNTIDALLKVQDWVERNRE